MAARVLLRGTALALQGVLVAVALGAVGLMAGDLSVEWELVACSELECLEPPLTGTAIGLGVVRQAQSNTLEISEAVRDRVAELQRRMPQGMSLRISSDDGVFIERSIHTVKASRTRSPGALRWPSTAATGAKGRT